MGDPDLGPNYAIIVDRRGELSELEARAEVANESLVGEIDAITTRLQNRLAEVVRLRINVNVGVPGSVPRNELGKTKRVFEQTNDEDPLG
jgi:phenylacetate-coenzyme A ligase PaaK-like adenylate-forming protein